jgi:hypothetical protein
MRLAGKTPLRAAPSAPFSRPQSVNDVLAQTVNHVWPFDTPPVKGGEILM